MWNQCKRTNLIIKNYLYTFSSKVPNFPGTPGSPKPGCWIYLPSGCSKNASIITKDWQIELTNTFVNSTNFDKWILDPYNTTHSSTLSKTVCEEHRKEQIDHFCKVNYTKMKYIGN